MSIPRRHWKLGCRVLNIHSSVTILSQCLGKGMRLPKDIYSQTLSLGHCYFDIKYLHRKGIITLILHSQGSMWVPWYSSRGQRTTCRSWISQFGFRDKTLVLRFSSKYLYLLSHLAGPTNAKCARILAFWWALFFCHLNFLVFLSICLLALAEVLCILGGIIWKLT